MQSNWVESEKNGEVVVGEVGEFNQSSGVPG